MPNIPHNYSITFRAASLLGSQCCVLRYAAAPLTPQKKTCQNEAGAWCIFRVSVYFFAECNVRAIAAAPRDFGQV